MVYNYIYIHYLYVFIHMDNIQICVCVPKFKTIKNGPVLKNPPQIGVQVLVKHQPSTGFPYMEFWDLASRILVSKLQHTPRASTPVRQSA